MKTITKATTSLFLDDQGEPVGLIYFNKNRERVIYIVHKADEEEIISLFNAENRSVSFDAGEKNTTEIFEKGYSINYAEK